MREIKAEEERLKKIKAEEIAKARRIFLEEETKRVDLEKEFARNRKLASDEEAQRKLTEKRIVDERRKASNAEMVRLTLLKAIEKDRWNASVQESIRKEKEKTISEERMIGRKMGFLSENEVLSTPVVASTVKLDSVTKSISTQATSANPTKQDVTIHISATPPPTSGGNQTPARAPLIIPAKTLIGFNPPQPKDGVLRITLTSEMKSQIDAASTSGASFDSQVVRNLFERQGAFGSFGVERAVLARNTYDLDTPNNTFLLTDFLASQTDMPAAWSVLMGDEELASAISTFYENSVTKRTNAKEAIWASINSSLPFQSFQILIPDFIKISGRKLKRINGEDLQFLLKFE